MFKVSYDLEQDHLKDVQLSSMSVGCYVFGKQDMVGIRGAH
jgi:hypothetical protein